MGLTKAERHNRMMDKIFTQKKKFDQIEDFRTFWYANSRLNLKQASELFETVKTIPF